LVILAGRQLRQAREIDARHRAKLINQAINRACIGLLNLINMPWLTISNHLVLPLFSSFEINWAMVKHFNSRRQIFT
jgi:hypothetical protein